MQRETGFKKLVQRDLKKLPDCYALKTQERSRRGVPDLLICLRGKFVAIELKDEGEEPTELQAFVIKRIQIAGGYAFWTSPSQWPTHLRLLKGIL